MVSSFTAKALGLVTAACLALSSSVFALEVGEYYRPSGDEVSGIPGTTATYRRSPCPALNTLANHGYLPRNGQNITRDILASAIEEVYNIGSGVAAILVAQVPETTTLDYLSTHNNIEHDASLAHADAYYGGDPMNVSTALAEDLFSRAGSDGLLTDSIVAQVRQDRGNTCNADNPECAYGVKAQTLAFLEASVLIMALGSGDSISVDHARSFIVDEKIPDDWTKVSDVVGVAPLLARAAKLKTLSLF